MSFRDIVGKSASEWMKGTGPDNDIVLGSRVRLARNVAGVPVPAVAGKKQLADIVDQVAHVSLPEEDGRHYEFVRLGRVPPLERQLLIEKHLISPSHAEQVENKAVVLRNDEAVSIMVNEEDHLRIQALFPGLQLQEAWRLASEIDDRYDAKMAYAFSLEKGYLTACPTNVGTGMRASVMAHLPALRMTNQIRRVVGAVTQFGLVVRGLYGEGSEATGNIFQFSNQVTLGRTEDEVVGHLIDVTRQITDQERQARQIIGRKGRAQLEDRIWRSYGVLAHARSISTHEAMQLLSDVRLGIDMGIVDGLDGSILQELLVMIRPAHLQRIVEQELTARDRDVYRAQLIRERIK